MRYAYATNGQGIYQIDMLTGVEGEVAKYPTPDELWAMTFAEADAWRDRFATIPFEDKGGSHPPRYYQDIAIAEVLRAIAEGCLRILLTLATGTGKTFIAFQIAWKLFHARWNLSGQPTRRPRTLQHCYPDMVVMVGLPSRPVLSRLFQLKHVAAKGSNVKQFEELLLSEFESKWGALRKRHSTTQTSLFNTRSSSDFTLET